MAGLVPQDDAGVDRAALAGNLVQEFRRIIFDADSLRQKTGGVVKRVFDIIGPP